MQTKISVLKWLKEYAIAYVLALFLAFCVFFILIINTLGWQKIYLASGALGLAGWKTIVMLVSGAPMAIKMVFQAALSGQLSSVFEMLLIFLFFLLPVLHLFIEQDKRRKLFWALWGVLWGGISLMAMGIAVSVVVPVSS